LPKTLQREFKHLCESQGITFITQGLRDHFSGIDIGITYADWGIAETGTIIMDSSNEDVSLASMISDVHIAMLAIHRICKSLFDLEKDLRVSMKDAPNYTAFNFVPAEEEETCCGFGGTYSNLTAPNSTVDAFEVRCSKGFSQVFRRCEHIVVGFFPTILGLPVLFGKPPPVSGVHDARVNPVRQVGLLFDGTHGGLYHDVIPLSDAVGFSRFGMNLYPRSRPPPP
jgi:hypothetical protein